MTSHAAPAVPIVRIVRAPSTDMGTFGVMTFGAHNCRTTELPWRGNRPQKSCIPPGTYLCAMVQSPRFGSVYGVANVPGRSAVLIHSANFGGDESLGYTTQLQGCIAPCERVGVMRGNAQKMQTAGLVSRPALNRFMAWAGGKPFILEIT